MATFPIDPANILRDVEVDGHRLTLWDTNERDRYGKAKLGYMFHDLDGKVLFMGEDYHCSPCHAIDSDDSVRGILCFLTLRPGDTDDEYFAEYTPDQLDFANTRAEYLQAWADDGDQGSSALGFDEWMGGQDPCQGPGGSGN